MSTASNKQAGNSTGSKMQNNPNERGNTSDDRYSAMGRSGNAARAEDVREDFQELVEDIRGACASYCLKRPGMAALGMFAVGFFVGWKLKPW